MLQDLPVWLAHFRSQAAHPRQVPATLDDTLTLRERRLIEASIALFQLGESSDGAQLRRAVRHHCRCPDDSALPEIFELFIAEERRHASLLGEFMADHEIPARERALSDAVFRALRHVGGLEARLRILVTAEIIGIVYYRALEVVTDCRRLRILCRILVADELAHVAFESQLLLASKNGRTGLARLLTGVWEQCILTGAALGGLGNTPAGTEIRRLRRDAVPAGLPQPVRLLSEVAGGAATQRSTARTAALVDAWHLSAPFACMKPRHTFRGVVMKTDPAARLKSLAPNGLAAAGGPARVRVGRETAGRSGKGVTVVTGLPLSPPELEALGTRLKKLCGAGGAVRDGILEIQGDHRDRLVQELVKLGFEAKRSGG